MYLLPQPTPNPHPTPIPMPQPPPTPKPKQPRFPPSSSKIRSGNQIKIWRLTPEAPAYAETAAYAEPDANAASLNRTTGCDCHESRERHLVNNKALLELKSILFMVWYMYHIYLTMIRVKVMISPFAKLMSKFLPGFLTASVDFRLISGWNFGFPPDFQLEISQISLSNSWSDLKVKVGQLAFLRSNYLSKLKILTEIRISTIDPRLNYGWNFGFCGFFSLGFRPKIWTSIMQMVIS